jgi:hypothetical protein
VTVNATDGVDTVAHSYIFTTEDAPLLPVVYLSPTGNDTTGDGSAGNPYETVAKGVARVTPDGVIYFYPGTFTMNEQVTLNKSVSFNAYIGGGASSQNVIISTDGDNRHFVINDTGLEINFNEITLSNGAQGSILFTSSPSTVNFMYSRAINNTNANNGGFGPDGVYDATHNPFPTVLVQNARHQFVAVKVAI